MRLENLPVDYVSMMRGESLLKDPLMAVLGVGSRGCCHGTRFTSINGDEKFQNSRGQVVALNHQMQDEHNDLHRQALSYNHSPLTHRDKLMAS